MLISAWLGLEISSLGSWQHTGPTQWGGGCGDQARLELGKCTWSRGWPWKEQLGHPGVGSGAASILDPGLAVGFIEVAEQVGG